MISPIAVIAEQVKFRHEICSNFGTQTTSKSKCPNTKKSSVKLIHEFSAQLNFNDVHIFPK